MEENSNKLFLTIVLTIFLITLAGGVGYLFYQNQQLKNQAYRITAEDTSSSEVTPTPSTQPTTPPVPYTESTTTPGQKKYVNPELGISFLYLSSSQGTNFKTKELGNKVYLHNSTHDYDTGQYVEVFEKEVSQTLKQAIEETLLEGYSEEKCLASLGELSASYPASYTKAIIKIAGDPSTMSMEEMSEKVAECPKIYTQFGGSAYFLMDNNHADKFVFFSIGQYHILAETEDIAWQDTIEFLD